MTPWCRAQRCRLVHHHDTVRIWMVLAWAITKLASPAENGGQRLLYQNFRVILGGG